MLQLNSIIFPKPDPSYSDSDYQIIKVISTVPSTQESSLFSMFQKPYVCRPHQIPCLYLKHDTSDEYLLFFHGNAEDLGYAKDFLLEIQNVLQMNVVAMEYPSYGAYTDKQTPTEEQIEQDAMSVYQFITNKFKVPESKIILFGRSMGGGPACYLASIYKPRCLILMSVFSSLRHVALKHASFLGYLVKDRFPNAERARDISCPTLMIHGKNDNLIPFSQSEAICENLASKIKLTVFPDMMSHNYFDMEKDLLDPIKSFFKEVDEDVYRKHELTSAQQKQNQVPSMWQQKVQKM